VEEARTPYFIGGDEQFARRWFLISSTAVRKDTAAHCQDGQQAPHNDVSIEQRPAAAALSRAF
jgi:hypothetical protein